MNNNITILARLLYASESVTLNNGPFISSWDTAATENNPENVILTLTWTDGEHEFSEDFTEDCINRGSFAKDGTFSTLNDGIAEVEEIRFYKSVQISLATISQDVKNPDDLILFSEELQANSEAWKSIAESKVAPTLADIIYLQMAILTGTYIEHIKVESAIIDLLAELPSSQKWLSFVTVSSGCKLIQSSD